MSAHVYQSPNSGEAQVWIARCFDHGGNDWAGSWEGPDRVHTDAGLALAFKDRDIHNNREHTDV